MILRGEESDFVVPGTVKRIQERGVAAARGLVESVEIPDCGHAPALMHLDQMPVAEEFLAREAASARARRASA